jgi:hypothetical protein
MRQHAWRPTVVTASSEQQRAAIRARWDRSAPERAAKALTAWARDKSAVLEPIAPHEVAALVHLAAVVDARVRARAAS